MEINNMDGEGRRRPRNSDESDSIIRPSTREGILTRIVRFVVSEASTTNAGTTVALIGEGGIGKTTVMGTIKKALVEAGLPTALISLDASSNHSPLRLLAGIARQLDRNAFTGFLGRVLSYHDKNDLLRQREYNDIVKTFTDELDQWASGHHRVAILVDNLDGVGGEYRRWIVSTIRGTSPHMRLVVSTRSVKLVESAHIVELLPFSDQDIEALGRQAGQHLQPDDALSIGALTGGNPLRVVSVIQAIAEDANFDMRHGERFADFLQRRLTVLSYPDRLLLAALVVAKARFTKEIFRCAIKDQYNISEDSFTNLSRLPFVIRVDDNIGYRIHDDYVEAVAGSPACRVLNTAQFIEDVLNEYYDSEILTTNDNGLRRQLISERIAYSLRSRPEAGLEELQREVMLALDRFDFDRTESLISAAEKIPLSESLSIKINLLRAEYLLKKYDSLSAVELLESTAVRIRRSSEAIIRAKHLELTGRCVANPVPIPHGDILHAVSLLRESVMICEIAELHGQSRVTSFSLAIALRAAGHSQSSIDHFENAYRDSRLVGDHSLAVRCLEEQSQTFRLMQDLPSARARLDDSYRYRVEHNVSEGKGMADYYAGNICRDSSDFSAARTRYESARAFFMESGDDNALCCLCADWAWLEYLAGESEQARALQMESFDLASSYRFGAELAEHWHTMYHLERDEGNFAKAYDYLEMGLAEAKRSSNMYMILDCSMHTAQRALAEGKIGVIEAIIEEMEAYERRGCGIRVFRGRTLMVLGDAYYSKGDKSRAYDAWREGLTIVAKFGNSRSNVELFDDIFDGVRAKLKDAISAYSAATSMRLVWIKEGLDHEFPAVTALCDEIESVISI